VSAAMQRECFGHQVAKAGMHEQAEHHTCHFPCIAIPPSSTIHSSQVLELSLQTFYTYIRSSAQLLLPFLGFVASDNTCKAAVVGRELVLVLAN